MAESPTDFIDFNAWKSATSATEAEALQRQQSDVDTKTAEADRLLRQSHREANRQNQHFASLKGSETTSLSRVGSYSSYLKAKQAASNARALMMLGKSGEHGDVRGQVDTQGGYSSGAESALERLRGQESRFGSEVDAGQIGAAAAAGRERDAIATKKAKEDARKAAAARDLERRREALRQMMKSDWAKIDAGQSRFGAPIHDEMLTATGREGSWFSSHPGLRAQDEAANIAAQARQLGMGDEAERYQSSATYDWGKRTKGGY